MGSDHGTTTGAGRGASTGPGSSVRATAGTAGPGPTPLARKLGIRPESRLRLVGAPPDFAVADRPPGVVLRTDPAEGTAERDNHKPANHKPDDDEPDDVVLFFVTTRVVLADRFAELAAGLAPAGGLWVCWPKRAAVRAGRAVTDLDDTVVRSVGLAAGLVDNKVCAVDEVWSGLRFVRRVADRSD